MSRRIVIMAGGTGGHVFPALAVARELAARGWNVSWLGTRAGLEQRVTAAHGIEIDYLAVAGVRGKAARTKAAAGFRFILACWQALRHLLRRKPRVVLGMGGFVAAPGGLMARCLSIPLVIHEQNRAPGTSNRLLLKLAAPTVLQAFPESFPVSSRAQTVGNPLRAEFLSLPEKASDIWRVSCGRPLRILVIGGSLGAQILNETIPEALADMENIEVLHQTGAKMHQQVADRYRELGLAAEVNPFIEDMAAAYQWADLAVCRAGAMTVSELAAAGLPAILTPFPYAIDDHQTANARYLCDGGGAVLLPQPELSPLNLRAAINAIKPELEAMSLAVKALARLEATQIVADICAREALK